MPQKKAKMFSLLNHLPHHSSRDLSTLAFLGRSDQNQNPKEEEEEEEEEEEDH
jgi:hypothetical protein